MKAGPRSQTDCLSNQLSSAVGSIYYDVFSVQPKYKMAGRDRNTDGITFYKVTLGCFLKKTGKLSTVNADSV